MIKCQLTVSAHFGFNLINLKYLSAKKKCVKHYSKEFCRHNHINYSC